MLTSCQVMVYNISRRDQIKNPVIDTNCSASCHSVSHSCFDNLGKNFGYVKFASKEAANDAIKMLHGQRICDMRLKVMEAEPLKYSGDGESSHKRPRT